MDSTAVGPLCVDSAVACATAQIPKSSAAGIESRVCGVSPGARSRSAPRSCRGAAALVSAACTSAGPTSETSHASSSRPARKA
eukprot:196210-Pleurochrysis_carterae.AAC.1